MKLFWLCFTVYLLGSAAIWNSGKPPCPDVAPLQVTIIDSGGADLKVTSSVEGCR